MNPLGAWLQCPYRALLWTALASAVALGVGCGFTVDDALISSRVGHHLSTGLGYRFNPQGPMTDAVTPLGWAHLLALGSHSGAWAGLQFARGFGVVCSLISAALVGWVLVRERLPERTLLVCCLPWAACLPWGAWGSSGMETPLVALLVTTTLFGGYAGLGGACLAAALRPELLPWAFVWAVTLPCERLQRRIGNVLCVLSGALVVAALRYYFFGDPAPLSRLAKPSDFTQGVVYALDGAVRCGLPIWLVSTQAYARLSPFWRSHAVAIAAHVGALAIAGGDWMALFRLYVPVLPICFALGALLLARDPAWARRLKLGLSSAALALLLVTHSASARGVVAAREKLLLDAAPALDGAQVVGTLDVGWVGALGPHHVLDFAGVTDPEMAWLPGGHTSKRLPRDLLWRRNVDALVLLTAPGVSLEDLNAVGWRSLAWARAVEQRVTILDGAEAFVPVAFVPLQHTTQHYVVLRRPAERNARR